MSPTDGAPAMPALPNTPPPPPMFGAQQKPKRSPFQSQPITPTFLGTGAMPNAPQLGKATLLGSAA